MIWTITAITLYLIISAASLVLICTNDRNGKRAYFDIRNIFVALIWPLVLLGGGLVGLVRWVAKEKSKTENNG